MKIKYLGKLLIIGGTISCLTVPAISLSSCYHEIIGLDIDQDTIYHWFDLNGNYKQFSHRLPKIDYTQSPYSNNIKDPMMFNDVASKLNNDYFINAIIRASLIIFNNGEGWTIERIKLKVNYHDHLLTCSYSLWVNNVDIYINSETYIRWETLHPVYIAALTNNFLSNGPAIFMGSLNPPGQIVDHWRGYQTYKDGTSNEGNAQSNVFWFVPSDWCDVEVPNGTPF